MQHRMLKADHSQKMRSCQRYGHHSRILKTKYFHGCVSLKQFVLKFIVRGQLLNAVLNYTHTTYRIICST